MNFHERIFMKKTRNTISFEISEEQEVMKAFLIGKGCNLSAHFRNYLIQLYDREKNKEVA